MRAAWRRSIVGALLIVPWILLSEACAVRSLEGTPGLVVTSIYPLQYLAQRIGGDRVTVRNLVPAGAEPHDWEPSPQDVAVVQRASVFIYNGAGYERWAERIADELPSKQKPVVVRATDDLEIYGEAAAAKSQAAVGRDPHVWLDPYLYGKQADVVKAAFAKTDPAGEAAYAANLASLKDDLERLADEIRQGLSSCQRDSIVTSHAAFGYLARRFGLRQVAISGLSPEAEPSPARLRELVQQVRSMGATHIFFETLVSPAVAQTLAHEVGAKTLVLDPLEGLTPADVQAGEDYLSVMRKNLINLRTALGCQ